MSRPLAQIHLVDVGLIEVRKEVLILPLFKELHLDGFMCDARDDHGTHLAELGVLQHRVKEDLFAVNILSGEVSEDIDVLRTPGKRQFYLHAVIVRVGKNAVLGNILY